MPPISASFTGPQYYDEYLGPAYFDPFAAELAQWLPPNVGGDVLEIACGTGLVTRRLLQRLDPSVRLVATDLNRSMLDYARKRLDGLAGIEWREADMLQLPFDPASFAAVVSGFGLMFAPDRPAALREIARVLRPGGLLLFSVWDQIEDNPHAAAAAQVIESLFPDDPDMKFRTPYELHEPQLLRELLHGAGLREPRIERRRLPISAVDPRQIATGQILGTPRAALIAQRGVAPETVIDRVAAALTASGGNPYHGHAQGLLVEARRLGSSA